MGITAFGVSLIDKAIEILKKQNSNSPLSVLELGAQQMYDKSYPDGSSPFADEYYFSKGFTYYASVDIGSNHGKNNINHDLSMPFEIEPFRRLSLTLPVPFGKANLVTDFGTSEHVGVGTIVSMGEYTVGEEKPYVTERIEITKEQALYNCLVRKLIWCDKTGVIISENPHTGHWRNPEDHPNCHHWFTPEFYPLLCEYIPKLNMIEHGTHFAMDNHIDGKEVYSIMQLHETITIDYMLEVLPFELFLEKIYNVSVRPE